MDDRCTKSVAIALLALALGSCQTSPARRASGKGEQLLAKNQNAAAAQHFDRAATLATDPLDVARAKLGLGRAKLGLGRHRSARNDLYEARYELRNSKQGRKRESTARRTEKESLEVEINRWIGETYLDGGRFELARRYLQRALPGLERADRQSVLAELVFLNREMGERRAATRYHRDLTRPYSREVAGMVGGSSARAREARARWASRERKPTPRLTARTARASKPVTRRARPRKAPRPLTLRIFPRTDWNARGPKPSRLKQMGRISRVTIHHSAGKPFYAHSHSDTATHIRNIQRYHQVNKKWADIGYHYIIDLAGNIWEGRARKYQGAHAGGAANRGNIGIVVLGNYTRQGLNVSQVRSLANLVGQLSDRYGIPHYRVHTHEELQPGHTACPGPVLARVVRQIRVKLRERHLALGD